MNPRPTARASFSAACEALTLQKAGLLRGSSGCVETVSQPAANESQLPVHGCLRCGQEFRCLFRSEPQEEAELDHFALARVQLLQLFQHAVQVDHLRRPGIDPCEIGMKLDGEAAVALLPSLGARMVHQDAAHQPRREAVEM